MVLPLIAAGMAAAPAIGAAALRFGPALLGAIPLIQDIFKGGADPAKLDKVKQMRDDRIEQIVGSMPGIDRNKATAQANQEFQEMISSAENEGKASGGEIATDVAGLASDIALGHFAAKGVKAGKKTNANAPTAGGPKTASEGVNGIDTAAKPMQNAIAKAPDEPEMVHNAVEERAEMPDGLPEMAMNARMKQAAMDPRVLANARYAASVK
jgi:hypothetical protein